MFDLQHKIVGEIATALKLRLVVGQRASQTAGGTSNPVAYEAYLRGLEFEHRASPEDFVQAVKQYEQAIALDPNFGSAIAELAWIYWTASGATPYEKALGLSENEAVAKMNEYIKEAAKHPSAAYYEILADRLIQAQKSDEAIATVERAIALDSSDPFAYEEMSAALTFNGRPADGIGYLDAAARVDPSGTPWRLYFGRPTTPWTVSKTPSRRLKNKAQSSDIGYSPITWPLQLLTAAAYELGRVADAASAGQRLSPI